MKKLIIIYVVFLLQPCVFALDHKLPSSPEGCQELIFSHADYSYVVQVIKKLNSVWKKDLLEKDNIDVTIDLDKNGNLLKWYFQSANTPNDRNIIIKTLKKASPYGKVKYPNYPITVEGDTKIRLIFTNKNIELYKARQHQHPLNTALE